MPVTKPNKKWQILHKSMLSARSHYETSIARMEAYLMDKIDFEFHISDFPDDGFAILNVETSSVAPLDKCLVFINVHGLLSEQQHEEFSI